MTKLTRNTSRKEESQVEDMEDLEEELTKLEEDSGEAEVSEKEAGNKSKEKHKNELAMIHRFSGSRKKEKKNTSTEKTSQKEARNSQVRD